jgi:hypothetical protein
MDIETFFAENADWRKYADVVAYPPLPEEIKEEFPDVCQEVLDRCMEPVKEAGFDISRGAIYIRVRREDRRVRDSAKWATMLCLQAPPGLKTTDTFWSGRKTWVEHFGEEYANNVKAQFAKKGISIGANCEYMPELVRPGYGPHNPDPEAIVSFDGARSYIKKLCESRGWACEGAVNVEHRQPESDPLADEACIPVADDLVRAKGRLMMQESPDVFSGKSRAEAREMILEKYGPSKTKGSVIDASQIGE